MSFEDEFWGLVLEMDFRDEMAMALIQSQKQKKYDMPVH
jgi:hypothetical protein